ncbi:glycosyltransferase family 2 protein [bacterium]|nr:glycosyltransferase family 2 protein [bacterium]
MTPIELSIFFPAYNEAKNLPELIERTDLFIQQYAKNTEVIVVNDGSSDNSKEVLKQLEAKYGFLKSVHHPQNQGYGAALRSGFSNSQGKLVFFMDSDNQFHFDELKEFIKVLEDEKMDGVIGIRTDRKDNFLRKTNTFLWCSLVRLLLGIRFKDIDCAYKLFKKELIKDIKLETTGAMISTELLFQVQKRTEKIVERHVNHYPRTQGSPTGANPLVILRAFKELFSFYFQNVFKS